MLRSAIKQLPIVGALLRSRHVDGPFASWAAAASAAASYDDDLLNRFRVARERGRPAGDPDDALLKVARDLPAPTVIDFGGGPGDAARDLVAAVPTAHVVVVENATMTRIGRRSPGVEFASAMPRDCDVFFTRGTLQYLDVPMAVLEAGFRAARHAVVLAHNAFARTETFWVQRSSLYVNGSGPIPAGYENIRVTYPCRTLVEKDVLALAEASGFRLVERARNDSGVATANATGFDLTFRR